jgi:hypothetical protein
VLHYLLHGQLPGSSCMLTVYVHTKVEYPSRD